jgi:hypothetical protein
MSGSRSVTLWLRQLEAGDPAAAHPLWERYFPQLVHLARGKLRGARLRAADEEDVALSAFDSFCRGVAQGRFPQLNNRNNLWGLLFTLTERKAIDLAQYEGRQKRGGGRLGGESALPHSPEEGRGLEQIAGPLRIAFARHPLGFLGRDVPVTQPGAEVSPVEGHSPGFPNQFPDALGGPQLVGEAVVQGVWLHPTQDYLLLLRGQLARPTRHGAGGQPLGPLADQGSNPAPDGTLGDAPEIGDFLRRVPLAVALDRETPSFF